ncbi:MAG: bifunctional hydroxymethylpyrimidine kinase/phosphomethylpyrimidine kinase [Gammaproteobacteria bacterium]
MKGRVLIVAGSDSGGGAGVQADIKTVTALGGYAANAITALTAQNTLGVIDVLPIPAAFVAQQMRAILNDIGADCIKTGMLCDGGVIEAVREVLDEKARGIPVVADPVMRAHDGTHLLDPDAVRILTARLFPRVTLLTPNVPEAEALTGMRIDGCDGMIAAGRRLLSLGPAAVLVKGGHLPGPTVRDVLVAPTGTEIFEHARLGDGSPHPEGGGQVKKKSSPCAARDGRRRVGDPCLHADGTSTPPGASIHAHPRLIDRPLHGTGCTLASAIATGLAQGMGLEAAMRRARGYVFEAIRRAPGFGGGAVPLDHTFLWP